MSRPWIHVLFVVLVLKLSSHGLGATTSQSSKSNPPEALRKGKSIYTKLCVDCHGTLGEGVIDKYADPLPYEWSVEKLTRAIDRTMPEGAPEKCVGADASAVALYIKSVLGAQSRAKQAAIKRREPLARLTNIQFVNSVSDLVGIVTGTGHASKFKDNRALLGRGLRATYYDARGFNAEKKKFDRIDPHLSFDFGTGSPTNTLGTNEFSIQWRGALKVDETGYYEFFLKSPNGVRLWFNREREPVIDAWVASGGESEHRFGVQLIGGRCYALGVDFFKFKDKFASIQLIWKTPQGQKRVIPSFHLLPEDVSASFTLQTRFPADDASEGIERGTLVSKEWDEAVTRSAVEVGNYLVSRLDKLTGSESNEVARLHKIKLLAGRFAAGALGAPDTSSEVQDLLKLHFARETRGEDSLRRVVLHSLKHPRFLYPDLSQNSENSARLGRSLALMLWDTIPDDLVLQKFSENRAMSAAELRRVAHRMVQQPPAKEKSERFIRVWLGLDHWEEPRKDFVTFPGFDSELVEDLKTSLRMSIQEFINRGATNYQELLRIDRWFVNERMRKFYGFSPPEISGDRFELRAPDVANRIGIQTHPYLLASLAYARSSSPIHRGVFLSRNILGRKLRPPPMAIAFKDDSFAPDLTMREKVTRLTSPSDCRSCHAIINPLGFAFEGFDGVGRWRESDQGKPIDSKSEYFTEEGDLRTFSGPRDVTALALEGRNAGISFLQKYYVFLTKRSMDSLDSQKKADLIESFIASDFNLANIAVEICLAAMEQESGPLRLGPTKVVR